MKDLIDTIHWLEQIFDEVALRRSYGGAIAYSFHGPPRTTLDVDVLVLVPDTKIPALIDRFVAAGALHGDVTPRPIDLRAVLAELRSKAHMTTFMCRGVRVEIFVPWHPFHHLVLERSPEKDLEGRHIRIHSAEDLIVFKKIFDRPKDIQDIKAMLMANKGRLDLGRVRADARGLLAEESWQELDRLLKTYG